MSVLLSVPVSSTGAPRSAFEPPAIVLHCCGAHLRALDSARRCIRRIQRATRVPRTAVAGRRQEVRQHPTTRRKAASPPSRE